MSKSGNGAGKADVVKAGGSKRAFGRDERDALVTQRRATAYGRARGKS